MGVATIAFRKCVIKSQSEGSYDYCGASRVIFDVDIDGDNYKDVYVEVREVTKSGTNESPLEISDLYGYEGPLNYEVLRGSIEFYFRQVMGEKESRTHQKGKILGLPDWEIEQGMVVQFEMPEEEGN